MYVCVCNAITERQVRGAVAKGAHTLDALTLELGVAAGCGRCAETACALIRDAHAPCSGCVDTAFAAAA